MESPPVEDEPTREDFERLKRWFNEEIERRDRIIEELRKENLLLVQSSLKTSERLSEMQGLKTSLPKGIEKVKFGLDDDGHRKDGN